jgi:hypothetical protein
VGLFAQSSPGEDFLIESATTVASRGVERATGFVLEYWAPKGKDRLGVLRDFTDRMNDKNWLYTVNSGWEPWDLRVVLSQWFRSTITTVQEDLGEGKRRFRARFTLSPTSLFRVALSFGVLVTLAIAIQDTYVARMLFLLVLLAYWAVYARAIRSQAMVSRAFGQVLLESDYVRVAPKGSPRTETGERSEALAP